jgi:hypothetical protein
MKLDVSKLKNSAGSLTSNFLQAGAAGLGSLAFVHDKIYQALPAQQRKKQQLDQIAYGQIKPENHQMVLEALDPFSIERLSDPRLGKPSIAKCHIDAYKVRPGVILIFSRHHHGYHDQIADLEFRLNHEIPKELIAELKFICFPFQEKLINKNIWFSSGQGQAAADAGPGTGTIHILGRSPETIKQHSSVNILNHELAHLNGSWMGGVPTGFLTEWHKDFQNGPKPVSEYAQAGSCFWNHYNEDWAETITAYFRNRRQGTLLRFKREYPVRSQIIEKHFQIENSLWTR